MSLKRLFDVKSKGSRTSEKQLMLYVDTARKQFCNKDVFDIGHVRSVDKLVDGLIESVHQAALQAVIISGKLIENSVQMIIRIPHNNCKQPNMPMEITFINLVHVRDNTPHEQAQGDYAASAICPPPVFIWNNLQPHATHAADKRKLRMVSCMADAAMRRLNLLQVTVFCH